MEIAQVSYEYPPDTEGGGIATYVENIVKALCRRNHRVTVFCGSKVRNTTEESENLSVYRIKAESVKEFNGKILEVFEKVYSQKKFDIVETPEINANALPLIKKYPKLPLIVRLHTPSFLINKLNNHYTSKISKLRFFLGALKRGRINFFDSYDKKGDEDFIITDLAVGITAPSQAMKDIICTYWNIEPSKIKVIPNIFIPSPELLKIPIKNPNKNVLFVGKLNVHKGLVKLTKAIPYVLKKYPDYKFTFIGNDAASHIKGVSMKEYMQKKLRKYISNIEFIGFVENKKLHEYYAQANICIFPSIWEAFGYVCQEAMAVGRAVVASKKGGMAEILKNDFGILINPESPKQMAKALMKLMENRKYCYEIGEKCRAEILQNYSADLLEKKTEEYYFEITEELKNKH